MPYILEKDRLYLDTKNINNLRKEKLSSGDLNYIISTLMSIQLELNGLRYEEVNRLVGVLECAKLELYRKVASPYEDLKEKENGKVYK